LTNGFVKSTSTNLLTLGSSATVSGGSSNSFVSGPLQWTVTGLSAIKTFAIGKGSNYRPVTLTLSQVASTSTLYTAEMFNSAPTTRNLTSGLTSVSSVRYYVLSSGSSNLASATLLINYSGDDNVTSATDLRVAKSNGPDWQNLGGIGTANGTGTITSGAFTSFGDFVLGSTLIPLPVKWISFSATKKTNKVELKWQTAGDDDLSRFSIERSSDGSAWNSLAEIASHTSDHFYQFTDDQPNTENYYRVNAISLDGKFDYSKIILVQYLKSTSVVVSPNPILNKEMNLLITEPVILQSGKIEIRIYDMIGQLKYSTTQNTSPKVRVDCNKLIPGNYLLMLKAGAIEQKTNFYVE